MGSLHFDVAVIGAGPAGANAALKLASAGKKVVMIEKARLPRYKTCGGGLLQRALKHLPKSLSEVVETRCYRAELHHHQPRLAFECHRTEPIVSMVMRDRFDHDLTSIAVRSGSELRENTSVTALAVHQEFVEIETTDGKITTNFVIAADGANSRVAKELQYPELPHLVPALEVEAVFTNEVHERFAHTARFDLGLTPFGYAWLFSKSDFLSLGVLTTRRGSCNLHAEYSRYTQALGIPAPKSDQKHGYIIPLRPRPKLFRHPRVLLVGDAAGLADPVIAEGISAALMSGYAAAEAVLKHPSDPHATIAAYENALRPWLSELKAARFLAKCLYECPRLRAWLLQRNGQKLSEFVTSVVSGEATYRAALSRPLNYARAVLGR